VLTQAGFLYLLPPTMAAKEDGGEGGAPTPPPSHLPSRPADAICLARCDLDSGDAGTLTLVEAGPSLLPGLARGRAVRLRAATVDDGCEWAAALKDAVRRATRASGGGRGR
jgi:hypothetical protein